jgi:hypothetical protein
MRGALTERRQERRSPGCGKEMPTQDVARKKVETKLERGPNDQPSLIEPLPAQPSLVEPLPAGSELAPFAASPARSLR